ncbi:MAG: sensor domain-containing diguanylate cyclase [Gammaproteobacteria bacterium]|nr:sensor domain-containing diguanylate cyclase [Gammaproteobacteria bacterium]
MTTQSMKKPLLILILIIALSEMLTMILMDYMVVELFWSWLPALLDASIVSLIAITASKFLFKKPLTPFQSSGKHEWTLIKIGVVVFLAEAIIMLTLELLPVKLTFWQEIIYNVIVLCIITTFILSHFVLKPFEKTDSHKTYNYTFNPVISVNTLTYLSFMILLLMILVSNYQQQFQLNHLDTQASETKELYRIKSSLLEKLKTTSLDAKILVQQGHLKEYINGNVSILKKLENDFKNVLKIKESYRQIRFLDASGMERIRIEYQNGNIISVPPGKLQNKAHRYYFKESIKLNKGNIYVSPIDLNMEHKIIEIPYRPVIRISTPVFNNQNIIQGVLIIKINATDFLKVLDSANESLEGNLNMLDESGYWIYGKPEELLWGSIIKKNSKERFQTYYPDAWEEISHTHSGGIYKKDFSMAFEEVEYVSMNILDAHLENHEAREHQHQWPRWKLVSIIPNTVTALRMESIRYLMIALYIIVVILAGFGTVFITQAMLNKQIAENQVKHLAFYDPLTGLTNRRLFYEKLELEISHARREKNMLALLYMDLDNFKPINDELGHEAGDTVLQVLAKRFIKCLRDSDTISRIGGDEFTVILPRLKNKDEIESIANRIIESVNHPFVFNNKEYTLGISIGISLLSDDDHIMDDLINRADKAMYKVKHSTRNSYHFA